MDAFYEKKKEAEEQVTFGRSCDHLFLSHYHINIEILIVRRGGYEVTIDGMTYLVKEGDIAFFDSYCIHSYDRRFPIPNGKTDDCVLVIPSKFFGPYDRMKAGRYIVSPIIHDPKLVDLLLTISDEIFALPHNNETYAYTAKFVLALISEKLQYVDRVTKSQNEDERELIHKCLSYIEKNYLDDCSRKQLAKIFGYSESYISHVFSKYVKIGIPAYVNNLKLQQVQNMLRENPDKSITTAVLSCGFNNVQTYYYYLKKYGENISSD